MAKMIPSFISTLIRPCKLLTLSIFLGFGLASCSGSDDKVDEPVADSAAPSGDETAAAVDATQTDAAPAEGDAAAAAAPDAATAEAAPAADGEQAVVALDEGAPPPADAPSEHTAADVAAAPEASVPADAAPADAASDAVSAELTDNKAPAAKADSPAPTDSGAAFANANSSFEAPTAPAAEAASDGSGNTISTPGSAKFVKGRHDHHAGAKGGKGKHHHHSEAAAPADAAAAPAGKGDAAYVVEAGDTLGKIATKIYGSTKNWQSLAELNKLSAPYIIRTGQSLQFDSSDAKAQAFVKGYTSNMKTVTVKKGDTLSTIAAQLYGNSGAWTRLLGYNRAKISDPNRIEVGMSLAYREDGGHAGATPDGTKAAAAKKDDHKDKPAAKADAKAKKKKGHKKDAE